MIQPTGTGTLYMTWSQRQTMCITKCTAKWTQLFGYMWQSIDSTNLLNVVIYLHCKKKPCELGDTQVSLHDRIGVPSIQVILCMI